MKPQQRRLLVELLAVSLREHYYCEDGWYTCPAHPQGSANENLPPDVCLCGAQEHNALISEIVAKILELES